MYELNWHILTLFHKGETTSTIKGCKTQYKTSEKNIMKWHPHSPKVLWAELWLHEFQKLVSSCRVFQGLLQREAPFFHPLLAGITTVQKKKRINNNFYFLVYRQHKSKCQDKVDLYVEHGCYDILGPYKLPVYITFFFCWPHLASKSQKAVSSLIQGLEGSVVDTKGSYSANCSV